MVRKVLYVSAECAECDFVSTHALGARVHSLATGHYVKDTRVYEVGPKK